MKKMINYIAKGEEIIIGLEDSKKTWKVCCRSNRRTVDRSSMPSDYPVLRAYLSNNFPQCRILVAYEAGYKGFNLHDSLITDGFRCIVLPPNRVFQEKSNKKKNDKRDALQIAKTAEDPEMVGCEVPDKQRREDRQVSRTLVGTQKDLKRVKNRIMKFMDFHGYSKAFSQDKWKARDWRKVRTMPLSENLRMSLDILLSHLDFLSAQKRQLKKKLFALSKQPKYAHSCKLMVSIPGIGRFTAIRLLLEWGEEFGKRFSNAKKMGSFSGLISSEYSTGESVRQGKITGESRHFVREWLIQCAWVMIRYDPAMRQKYDRVKKNSGNSKKAIVAVARKMVIRMRALLINDMTYELGTIE